MSDLYHDAVMAACESMGITWQDAADTIDPFLTYVREEMWNYGFGQSEKIIDILVEGDSDTEEVSR